LVTKVTLLNIWNMTTVTDITPGTNPYNTTMENRTTIEIKDRDTAILRDYS